MDASTEEANASVHVRDTWALPSSAASTSGALGHDAATSNKHEERERGEEGREEEV